MLDTTIFLTFILVGAAIGFNGVELLPPDLLSQVANVTGLRWVSAGFGGLFGLVFGLATQISYRRIVRRIQHQPAEVLLSRAVGLVLGLLVANLMLAPTYLIPIPPQLSFIKPMVAVSGSLIFAFSGVSLADTHGLTLLRVINPNYMESTLLAEGTLKAALAKVLDTSCIIDGRIEGLLDTGFIEGQLLVPKFVLEELQTLADGANSQKRTRGRRGLEILNRLQEGHPRRLVVHPADYEDIATVDAKLVALAQEINGMLVTNDYNLNKVASLQNIQVLNVNDLAQSLRPRYLPGDSLDLKILKEGKEPDQGVGYLEDGTMVVVEEAKDFIGTSLPVIVTSALQTSAGRMVFARTKASAPV
ncbi:MAG: PIN/TRAM domain-containing protein [Thermosynechococcaceae cyanobacterium]